MICAVGNKDNDSYWIVDSGSSQHVTSKFDLLYDRVGINEDTEMAKNSLERFYLKGKVKINFNHYT